MKPLRRLEWSEVSEELRDWVLEKLGTEAFALCVNAETWEQDALDRNERDRPGAEVSASTAQELRDRAKAFDAATCLLREAGRKP